MQICLTNIAKLHLIALALAEVSALQCAIQVNDIFCSAESSLLQHGTHITTFTYQYFLLHPHY